MTKNKQTGAVLIVSLLMLTVMTMIGVTAMQSNLLQEKMAGNFRDSNLAFQAAEAGLRDGEADVGLSQIIDISGFDSDCVNGLWPCQKFDPIGRDDNEKVNGVTYGTYTNAPDIPIVSCQPIYKLEGAFAKVIGGQWDIRYRVTASACGGNKDAQVTLQSVL